MADMTASFANAEAYLEMIFRESLWDKIVSPYVLLSHGDAILSRYARDLQMTRDALVQSFLHEDYGALLQEKFFELFRFGDTQ